MPARTHLAAALILAAAAASAPASAQTLPATSSTAPAPPPPAAPLSPARQPPTQAAITLTSGQLSIHADNSSLNQILRDISRLTGMKITGGVIDERVYGIYGPAPTAAVLTTLLNGTGSNMLLIEDARRTPQELVLTPRQGGPTPPNPNATRELGEADLPPQLIHRSTNDDPAPPPNPPPDPRPNPFNRPLPTSAQPTGAQATTNTTDPSSTPAAGTAAPATTQEQSPNGVKTPEQIYEQLLKLQQQQSKPPQP